MSYQPLASAAFTPAKEPTACYKELFQYFLEFAEGNKCNRQEILRPGCTSKQNPAQR